MVLGDANNIGELESQRQSAQVEAVYNLNDLEEPIRTVSRTLGSANVESTNAVNQTNETQVVGNGLVEQQQHLNNYRTIQIEENTENNNT